MKRRKIVGLTLAGLLAGAMTFSGCALVGGNSSNENSAQGEVSRIEAIYAQYIVYAEAQGQTPMSYEQWLETIKGADGKDGVDGQDGKDGVDGKSAYDIWLANGYSGTQADFLEWLKGEVGAQGEQGIQGEKGDQGIQGETGVGIESITVNADGDFLVTYTDGTTQIVAMPKENQHVHTFSDWLTFDESQGLLYHICFDCNSVEWATAQNITTAEELLSAGLNGGVVAVNNDIALPETVDVEKDLVVNLIGKLTSTINDDNKADGIFQVLSGATLTLNGDGIVDGVTNCNYHMAIWANGGDVVINGGTYTNVGADGDQNDLIYVKNGGTVTINGGSFKCETPAWTLNIHNTQVGSIVITGGSFYKFDPSNLPECVKNDNITVAYGYEVVQDGDWYIVTKEGINPLKTLDITAVQNMNAVLSQEGNVVDVFDVAAVLSKNGFDIENGLIPKLKYHAFYWHKPSNTIVYVHTKDGAFDLVYPEEVVAFSKDTCQYLGTKISAEAAKTPTAPATTTATPVGTTTNMPTDVDTFEELVAWSNQSNGKVETTLPGGAKKEGVALSGKIKLDADVVLGAKGNAGRSMLYNIAEDTTIDLNGHSITQANAGIGQSLAFFAVRSGATLTIIDSSANKTGKIAVGNTAFQIDAGATVNMYGGTITVAADRSAKDIAYGASLVWTNGGTFNMYGGMLDVASTNFDDNWAISNSGVANLFAGKVIGYIDESANIYDITK